MKVLKLVFGILSIILSLIVIFQSCAAGLSNALADSGEISGTAGLFVAVMMLAGGIVVVVMRNNEKIGGDVAVVIMYLLAALIGFISAGSYSDLNVWSFFCLFIAVLHLISLFGKKA